jgi:hypothetical protein
VTEDATDGRPWPIDPVVASTPDGPAPIPELGVPDGVPDLLAAFADSVNRAVPVAANGRPHPPGVVPAPPSPAVSDDDRTTYGVLLDRAAERGLLTQDDYQVRLRELAEATSVDQMRQIVTELPAFTLPPSSTTPRRSKRAPSVAGPAPAGGRRRTGAWLLLGIMVVVLLASLAIFAIYAEHLIHDHSAGLVSAPAAARAVSALRP